MAHVTVCLEAMPRTEAVDPSPQVMACMALAIMMAVADMGGCHPDLKDAQGLAKASWHWRWRSCACVCAGEAVLSWH